MNALKMDQALLQIQNKMQVIAPHRSPKLFTHFLPRGYAGISLSAVPKDSYYDLLRAKLCLGSLITLYDDYADRPQSSNPKLLELLYQLSFENHELSCLSLCPHERETLSFARELFNQMRGVLETLPHYKKLSELLEFDLQQFYSANYYSSLLLALPTLHSPMENSHYLHHNMGMVITSMMDLMAIPNLKLEELGNIRCVFLMGQRMGRIFNILVTYEREKKENDITSEISPHLSEKAVAIERILFSQEIAQLKNKIAGQKHLISSFSVDAYLDGLKNLQELHEAMEETI